MRSIALLLAAAALAAGCGGGGGAEGAAEAASKPDFIERADAICAEANSEREALTDPSLWARPLDYEKIARYAETIGAVYERSVGKLRGLAVPSEDKATVNAFLAGFNMAVKKAEALTETARREDELAGEGVYFSWVETASQPQRLAREYGLEDCASFGLP